MDVMTLAAKLTLNTAEFDAGLTKSEGKMKGLTSGGVAWGNLISQAVNLAGRAVTSLAKDVVKVGMDFDAQMSQVKALGQLEDDNFVKIRKRAMELGESTKFTAAQVGEAFSYMALAGWDTQEMLDGIDGVLNLAAASGEDLGRTSDIVTDAITAMGLTAKDSGHFVDVLAAASANSNTTVSQMGQAFKYLATTGGVLEYSIEDVATTLGLLANNGIKAGQAGTSMRQILNTLINPSDKAATAMEKLGISLFDPETNARKPLGQVLKEFRQVFQDAGLQLEEGFDAEEIQTRLDNLNAWYDEEAAKIEEMKSGKSKALKELDKEYAERFTDEITPNQAFLANLGDIGGLRGISSLFAIMASTDKDFDQLTEAIKGSEGAAEEMSKTMLDNLAGDITIMNSALEGLKIIVSDSFKNDLRSFVQTFTEEVGKMNTAFQEGGLLGMFTNLADWVINGITDAITNSEVTGEGAQNFGSAIGDFVGRTIANLVTKTPALIGGLFQAGVSLADGLMDGLIAGLFGTGEGTVVGLISNIQDEEKDAVAEAEKTSTQAKGILAYMDSLTEQYGEAAKNTEAWATALGKLKEVYPEINEFIKQEGGNLSLANQELVEYIENTKKRQIEEAKRKAISKYIEEYTGKLEEQTAAEIESEMARSQAEEARKNLVDYIKQYATDFTGTNGESIDQLAYIAYSYANEHGDSQTVIDTLVKTYKTETAAAEKSAANVETLANEAIILKTQMELAEKALANLASAAGSFGGGQTVGDGSYGAWIANQYATGQRHAIGSPYIPYDDYPALLHRGEQVLTATQARDYNKKNDFSGLEDRIISAIRAGMAGANVNAFVNGQSVTDVVNTRTSNELKGRRFAP